MSRSPSDSSAVRAWLVGAVILLLGGCAHNATPANPHDPWEETNRSVYQFNETLDRYVLKPAADGYVYVTPSFFRRGVSNFFNNVGYPNVILSGLLQGKFAQSARDTGRFAINTTLGLGGLLDVATPLGLPANEEDFGLVLASWGANSGPYTVLPAMGPYTVRHSADIPVSLATNPLTYLVHWTVGAPLTALYAINTRAELDRAMRLRDEAALDPYLFVRSAYLQNRQSLIHDGAPPADEYDDDFFDDFFDE